MSGHLFYGLQDDSRWIYRERTQGFRNGTMIDTEREVQVVGILDNWSFLEGAFSDNDFINGCLEITSNSLDFRCTNLYVALMRR